MPVAVKTFNVQVNSYAISIDGTYFEISGTVLKVYDTNKQLAAAFNDWDYIKTEEN